METKPANPKSEVTTPHPLLETMKEIVRIQQSVNDQMAGESWIKEAVEATRVDYSWAALDEAAELWRCAVPFKFWDKSAFAMDEENARMEVVDLLHFAISQELANVYAANESMSTDQRVAKVAGLMVDGMVQASQPSFEGGLRPCLKNLIHGLTHPKGNRVYWQSLFGLASSTDMKPETLVLLYKAKSVLNKFRTQMKANGKYQKIWLDYKEDNYYLTQWLSAQSTPPTEPEIMNWLVSTYRKMFSV